MRVNFLKYYFLTVIGALGLMMTESCVPGEEPQSTVPTIKIISISPTQVTQFEETLLLELEYLDYDGDLGSEDPDEKTLSVLDSRLSTPDMYHIPPIAPTGEEVAIRGTLIIPLNKPFLLGNGNSEEVFFTVSIRDQADQWSEPEVTPSILITR